MKKHISGYTIFKRYVRLVNNTVLLRHRYVIGRENIPSDGRCLIASNHENAAMDTLNMIFELPDDMVPGSMARGNMFGLHPLATRFLTWLGIIPAYRLAFDGAETLDKNMFSFHEVAQKVNSGVPVIVFPSAGHSQGHYLLPFTTGIVRMGFNCLEEDEWRHDVKIVPTAVAYSSYTKLRAEFLWIIGKPISLLPYKDEYQKHPFKVMRAVRDSLHASVEAMMLDEGKDHYEEVDFLRRSPFFNPAATGKPLPDRLDTDRRYVEQLRSSDNFDDIMRHTRHLVARERTAGLCEDDFANKGFGLLWRIPLLVFFLPIGIIALWPHALCYSLPPLLIKEDKMFVASYRFVISVVFIYPLTAILTIAAGAALHQLLAALLWISLWLPTGVAGAYYYRNLHHTIGLLRRLIHPSSSKPINRLRRKIRSMLSTFRTSEQPEKCDISA